MYYFSFMGVNIMTPQDLIDYYGNAYMFGKTTPMTAQSLHNWVKKGVVPVSSQLLIEKLTEGKLKAEWNKA
jgi:hypothetical protein